MRFDRFFAAALLFMAAGGAQAAPACGGDFGAWLADFEKDAQAAGISSRTISAGLTGVTPDPQIIALDHHQGYFKQSFETYRTKRVPPGKVEIGLAKMRDNAGLLARIEKQYGVPGPILVAIWGLETGFGAGTGTTPTIRALATLAHDCRRSAFFTNELVAALQIADRGDLSPAAMKGGWAGELGQTQFLPSSYMKFAVDFDGDGRRDLIHSYPDVLASTANYLKGYGWHAGQPWGEGTANFTVLHQWNKADVYCRTIVWFAQQLDNGGGPPRNSRG
jgi:lytic murein transglycosylase